MSHELGPWLGVAGAFLMACAAAPAAPVTRATREAPPVSGAQVGPAAAGDVARGGALPAAAGAQPSQVHAVNTLQLGASRLHVQLDAASFERGATPIVDWILRCARAVEAYYGVFPVPEAQLVVHASPGRGVHGGHTQPGRPPRIDIRVGTDATESDLARNWSLTHELVHLAFPNLAERHLWLEEGLASYVEPIARARAQTLAEDAVWLEWHGNLKRGLPEAGDRGLDHTPTWARTYWGGALFCFLADLQLRRDSGGRVELRDALRGIVAAGGNINQSWPIERALRIGDAASGGSVLTDLYQQMKDTPVRVDLDGIWSDLGISVDAGRLRYDASARLAELRAGFVLGAPAGGAAPGNTGGR